MKLKSGTLFGIAMIVVFLIALVSAVISRMQMNDYLENSGEGADAAEQVQHSGE